MKTVCESLGSGFDTLASVCLRLLSPSRYSTQVQPSFRSNVFVDISATLETKVQAMALYESEARPFPHPRSPEALRAIAWRWGSVVGVEAAEAFELVRSTQQGNV